MLALGFISFLFPKEGAFPYPDSKNISSINEQPAKFTELKNKAMDESQEAISDIRAAIDELEPKLERAEAKAMEMADTTDDKWDDAKESLKAGWDEVSAKSEKARTVFPAATDLLAAQRHGKWRYCFL
ncbi:hypothetical protein [Methylomicrobium lacus]|uniref:hypothetical protein n=1 Tax=Methylomicrobium lacus TaxID=136992 RepID=UPI0035A82746